VLSLSFCCLFVSWNSVVVVVVVSAIYEFVCGCVREIKVESMVVPDLCVGFCFLSMLLLLLLLWGSVVVIVDRASLCTSSSIAFVWGLASCSPSCCYCCSFVPSALRSNWNHGRWSHFCWRSVTTAPAWWLLLLLLLL